MTKTKSHIHTGFGNLWPAGGRAYDGEYRVGNGLGRAGMKCCGGLVISRGLKMFDRLLPSIFGSTMNVKTLTAAVPYRTPRMTMTICPGTCQTQRCNSSHTTRTALYISKISLFYTPFIPLYPLRPTS